MARQRRNSRILEKAQNRLCGIKATGTEFDPALGISVEGFSDSIKTLKTTIDDYNNALAVVDKLRMDVDSAEKKVSDYASKMLTGMALVHGKDSHQYKTAGGTQKGKRKRSPRKAAIIAK